MRGIKGDLLGFTFGGVHSSALGITRTQNGLYDKSISPPHKDVILNMPKSDYTHYYGTTLGTRVIPINFAFEQISDLQISRMKQIWNDNKIHNLIFDEEPYKVYSAKLTGITTIKHICFEQGDVRYYNGTGSLNFECYFPYAKSRFPYIEDYNYKNIPEWSTSIDEEIRLSLYPNDTITQPLAWVGQYGANDQANIYTNTKPFPYLEGNEISSFSSFPEANISYEQTINLHLWRDASGIPSNKQYGIMELTDSQLKAKFKNPGDANAMIKLWLKADWLTEGMANKKLTLAIWLTGEFVPTQSFNIQNLVGLKKPQQLSFEDEYLCIDFYNQTIMGYKKSNGKMIPTNNCYNKFAAGEYLIFPPKTEAALTLGLTSPTGSLPDLEPYFEITYLYL